MPRRAFGTTRRLPSGRWQARYYAPDGKRRSSPESFLTKTDAGRWLAKVETEISRGQWTDPTAAAAMLRGYAEAWLTQRTVKGKPLAPRTVQSYRHSLDAHILPTLGDLRLSAITPAVVRTWHAGTLASGETAARQAYATLRAILNTAVADDVISRNPCRIVGAGQPRSAERPLLDLDAVEAITAQMPEHFRTLVTVAFWASLRIGEAVSLQHRDVDLDAGTLRVERQQVELTGKRPLETPPKMASRRTVHLPTQAVEALRQHLAENPRLPAARLFATRTGTQLRAYHVQQAWQTARRKAGYPQARIHDLRHASLTLNAQLGATTAELMRRAGHASARAAQHYQHAAESRDKDLAALLSKLDRTQGHREGTRPDRRPRDGRADGRA
jgi:integrase